MSKARLVITAVVVEGRPVGEVAKDYRVARSWVYELVARYRAEGETAFEPRSRRPNRSPRVLPNTTVELILHTRRHLLGQGLDGGPETITWVLEHRHGLRVGTTTIHRYLRGAGLVTPQPQKRPRSSYVRFEADQPNETWQADFTHYPLATGTDSEILSWLDDHARYVLSLTAHVRVSGPIVVDTFLAAGDRHGLPASTLTDNAMVFTTRLAGGHGGRNAFEATLVRLGVVQKNSRPNHPTTCGKVERFQATLKTWLRAQPQPATIADLQALLDVFVDVYNQQRPHRSLPHRAPPAVIYAARPKAGPSTEHDHPHHRVRHDRVDDGGSVTLRVNGQLHHIGVGRTHARTPVVMLINNLDVRIVHAATGELLRHLTLDPNRRYHGTGQPPGPPPRKPQQPHPS